MKARHDAAQCVAGTSEPAGERTAAADFISATAAS
jgi:hypothetical protein